MLPTSPRLLLVATKTTMEKTAARKSSASAPGLRISESAAFVTIATHRAGLDFGRFPALRGAAPRAVTVRAGDVLYLPCGWWHAVRGSADFNLSVNHWFALHDEKKDQGLVMSWLTSGQGVSGEEAEEMLRRLQGEAQP